MAQICYYGDRISPNMAETPEGFLICKNVPIARTGFQHYLSSEIYDDGNNDVINVYRAPSEVFSIQTLSSFEGKPVTNGHPDVDVTPQNYRIYAKGHVQHVRAGKGDDADKIIADLYITDPALITEIRNGKREVSAGYYAEDSEDEHGRVCQHNIRGNHVAVVDEGRAGHTVAIRDAKARRQEMSKNFKRKKMMANFIAKKLMDAKPETINQIFFDAAEAMVDEITQEDEDVVAEEEVMADEDLSMDEDINLDEDIEDEDLSMDEDINLDEDLNLDEDIEDEDPMLDEDLEDEDIEDEDVVAEEEVIDEDPMLDEDLEDEDIMTDGDMLEDESEIMTDECGGSKKSVNDSVIKSVSAAAMKIKNPRDRQIVQDALLSAVSGHSQMNDLVNIIKKNQAKRDSSSNIDTQRLQKIYDKLNPHKQSK